MASIGLQNAVNSCESKVIEKMQEVFKNEVGGAIRTHGERKRSVS